MPTRSLLRRALAALVVALTATTGALADAATADPPPSDPDTDPPPVEPGSHQGTIDGARYRVEVPEGWNGTLVLYAHGYFPPGFPDLGAIPVTNHAATEAWLLDQGYALAASWFATPYGFAVGQGYDDTLKLLDWFEAHVGQPRHVIASGQSLGGVIATRLGEERPDRVDGVADICAAHDSNATFNAGLDVVFAVKTLLMEGAEGEAVELVHPTGEADAAADTAALAAAVERAAGTREGRAKLALVASLNNVTGWWSALSPRPTDPDEVIRQQARWIGGAYVNGYAGPSARVDLEARLGGNPSSNEGIDYGRLVQRSSQSRAVRDAYRRAGVSLQDDLAKLAAAPRIAADPAAAGRMAEVGVPSGELRVPMVTVHTIGDGGAPPDQERWYAGQVRRRTRGDLVRNLYVDRGQHCSISAADEAVTVEALARRIETGRWPDTSPRRLNERVAGFAPELQVVVDLSTYPFPTAQMPPAFVRFTPPALQHPSY